MLGLKTMNKRSKAPSGSTTVRDPRLFISALEKAMRVLMVFRYDRPISIAEVARLSGIGRSAAQRYCHTWQALHYIRKAPGENGYVLSPRVLGLATQYLRTNYILERAHPYLMECNRRTQERVVWGELDDLDYVLLFQIPSQKSTEINTPTGMRFPAFSSASGLAMMAFLPPERIKDILDRSELVGRTKHTVTDRSKIEDVLKQVQKKGYCITEQSFAEGQIAVSAPVFGRNGEVIAAVNISALLVRHSREKVESDLAPAVVETAQIISQVLRGL